MATATGAHSQVTIAGASFHLYRELGRDGTPKPARIRGEFGAGDITQQQISRDVPRIWDDWSGGGGYSRRDARVPNGYAWCIGDARFPGVFAPAGQVVEVTLPPGLAPAPPYDSFEANDKLWFLLGRHVVSVNQSTGAVTVDAEFPAGTTATSAEWYNDDVYVGTSGHALWRYRPSTNTWTPSSTVLRDWLAVVYWVVAGFGAYRLVGAVSSTNQIKVFPSDPTAPGDPLNDADWSAAYPIGGTERVIRNIAASATHAYPIKTDGIYDVDGRGFAPNLTPYWRQQHNPSSGLTSVVKDNYVYASHVLGLDRVQIGSGPDRDRPEWCQPGVGSSAEGPVFGTVRAVGVDGRWLVGAQFNGTDSYICYGLSRDQPGVPQGPGPILWHTALAKIPDVVVTHVKVHEYGPATARAPWLWIGGVSRFDSTTPTLFRMATVRAANPMQALAWPGQYGFGTFPFADTATLVLPIDDWGDPTAVKVLRRFDVQADNLADPLTYLQLYASAEGGDGVLQGTVTASPRETLVPVDPLTTGYQVGLEARLFGTSTAPALLRALKARAAVSVDATEQRLYTLELGQMTEGLNRARDRRDPEVQFAQLWGLQMAGPVPMRDHRGRDLTVKVENVSSEEVEVPGSAGRRWALVARVLVSILQRPGYWDVNLWTTDATWSGGGTPAPLPAGQSAVRSNGSSDP